MSEEMHPVKSKLACCICKGIRCGKLMDIQRGEIFSKKRDPVEHMDGNSRKDDELYECFKCGVRFLARNAVSEYSTRGEEYFGLLSESNRLKEYQYVAAKIRSRIGEGSILDVGCGTGIFLDTLEPAWKKVGVEPSSYAAEQARDRNIEVLQGEFISVNFPRRRFDVITMIDVIEHLELPKENLEKAFSMLKPGGIVVIETGDIGSLTARLAGSRWTYFNPPEHICFFSKKALIALLKQIGFVNIEVSRVTHGLEYSRDFGLFIKGCAKALVKISIIGLRNLAKQVMPRVDLFDMLPPFNLNFKIPPFYDHIIVVAQKAETGQS